MELQAAETQATRTSLDDPELHHNDDSGVAKLEPNSESPKPRRSYVYPEVSHRLHHRQCIHSGSKSIEWILSHHKRRCSILSRYRQFNYALALLENCGGEVYVVRPITVMTMRPFRIRSRLQAATAR